MGLRELILEDRPLLYFSMGFRGNPNAAPIENEAGPDLNGVLNDMVEVGLPVRVEPHVLGTAWRWDGSSTRRLDVAADARLNVTKTTVEVVAASTASGSTRRWWNRDNDTSVQWGLGVDGADKASFFMRETETGPFRTATGSSVIVSADARPKLFHIVGTWDHGSAGPNSGGGRIFVDGKEEGFVAGTLPLMTNAGVGVRFGGRIGINDLIPVGYTAHAAFYNYALSPQRIREHARAARSLFLPAAPARRARLR